MKCQDVIVFSKRIEGIIILTLREDGCYGVARAEVAQLAEHSPEKAGVDSSILSLGTTNQ